MCACAYLDLCWWHFGTSKLRQRKQLTLDCISNVQVRMCLIEGWCFTGDTRNRTGMVTYNQVMTKWLISILWAWWEWWWWWWLYAVQISYPIMDNLLNNRVNVNVSHVSIMGRGCDGNDRHNLWSSLFHTCAVCLGDQYRFACVYGLCWQCPISVSVDHHHHHKLSSGCGVPCDESEKQSNAQIGTFYSAFHSITVFGM